MQDLTGVVSAADPMTQKLLTSEAPQSDDGADDVKWRQFSWLPCELTLDLPVAHFTVRDLIQLRAGTLVETCYSRGAEIPLRANGQLIGWAEFEPVGEHIGVRITELS